MIGHPDERRLLGFLDGRSAEGDRQRIARHLAGCQRCRDVVQGHRSVRAVFRLEPPSAPGGVLGRILDTRAGGGAVVLPVADPGASRPGRGSYLALVASAAAILVVAMVQLVPAAPFHAAWQWWSRTVAELSPGNDGSPRRGLAGPLMPAPVAKPAVLHPERLRPMTARYRYINIRTPGKPPIVDSGYGFALSREQHSGRWHLQNLKRGWDDDKYFDAEDLALREWYYRIGGSATSPAHQHVTIAGDWARVETTITGNLTPGVRARLEPGTDSFRVPGYRAGPATFGYWSNVLFTQLMTVELHDGWSGAFTWVDIDPSARMRALNVESYFVDGSGTVRTPAGSFESWRVRQILPDGEGPYIFWLRKADGLMIKRTCGRPIPGCDVEELLSVTYP